MSIQDHRLQKADILQWPTGLTDGKVAPRSAP